MLQDDCCLLFDICLNSERISYLLEYRFKRNSNRTSFDFKCFLPEQPSNNRKISHSLTKNYSTIIKSIDNDDENVSSESSEDEIEQISSPKSSINLTDDDYLDKLAEWEPNKSTLLVESNEDEEEEETIQQMNDEDAHIDSIGSSEMPSAEIEDLLVTFVHCPVKNEPMIYDTNDLNLPQLDGQTDFLFNNNHQQQKRKKNETKISTTINEKIHSDQQAEKSVWEHMILAEQKLNSFRKVKNHDLYPIEQKYIPTISKSMDSSIKKRKQSNNKLKQSSRSKSKKLLPMVHTGKTLLDYFKVIKRNSPIKNQQKTKIRSDNYFDGCIVIDDDDDDTQEIEQQRYTISKNIHTREKLLDHTVHSSEMRIKWLLNVELILLEHISIYHEQNIQSRNQDFDNSLFYHINSSFISIIILNFLKIFIIRNSNDNHDELSFYQFGLTSYLRYLLIELPTYKHKNLNEENDCFDCKQYSLIINILFDLLFDLMEHDVCEIYNKEKYRSSLIEDDYFNQLKIMKKNQFYRIKLIIYFIELIGIHKNKCTNKKEEFFLSIESKTFYWIEYFIRHIIQHINNLNNERISICFNVMELNLLFVNEKENHMKQMALFLAKLCEDNPTYTHLFLFDENLLPDIRILLINELIWNKFNIKFISIDYIKEFFHRIEISLESPNPIDDITLLLIRSLFNTYADLMIDLKHSIFSEQVITIFRHQLESIYIKLLNICDNINYFQQIKRTVILFRLLKCKWNRL